MFSSEVVPQGTFRQDLHIPTGRVDIIRQMHTFPGVERLVRTYQQGEEPGKFTDIRSMNHADLV